jgi:hypothetical protein
MEIVRYDRSGKWYLEPTDLELKRQHVSVQQAVSSAHWGIENANGVWHMRRPGGSRFDSLMSRSRPIKEPS